MPSTAPEAPNAGPDRVHDRVPQCRNRQERIPHRLEHSSLQAEVGEQDAPYKRWAQSGKKGATCIPKMCRFPIKDAGLIPAFLIEKMLLFSFGL